MDQCCPLYLLLKTKQVLVTVVLNAGNCHLPNTAIFLHLHDNDYTGAICLELCGRRSVTWTVNGRSPFMLDSEEQSKLGLCTNAVYIKTTPLLGCIPYYYHMEGGMTL